MLEHKTVSSRVSQTASIWSHLFPKKSKPELTGFFTVLNYLSKVKASIGSLGKIEELEKKPNPNLIANRLASEINVLKKFQERVKEPDLLDQIEDVLILCHLFRIKAFILNLNKVEDLEEVADVDSIIKALVADADLVKKIQLIVKDPIWLAQIEVVLESIHEAIKGLESKLLSGRAKSGCFAPTRRRLL